MCCAADVSPDLPHGMGTAAPCFVHAATHIGMPVHSTVFSSAVSCAAVSNSEKSFTCSGLVQEDDYGRARVHTQWGNDAELIEEAVQMCPVDCIAYVSPSPCNSPCNSITLACLLWH